MTTKNDNKKSKAKIIALAATITGVATAAVLCIKKGKTAKLQDFDFKNIPAGFTGKVKGKLNNGDKLVMKYDNGVLVSSTRSGSKNVSKLYQTVDGEKIVKITENNKTTTKNITAVQNTVKNEQSKLKTLLDKNDEMSSSDFNMKALDIKYKSNNQQKTIDKIISDKKAVEEKIAEYNRKNKDISEIIFKDGKPYLKDKPEYAFYSTIHATLPNNDKVTMEYGSLGDLKKAQRTGEVNFTKEYIDSYPSDKIVKITKDGKTENINYRKKAKEGLAAAEDAKRWIPVNKALEKFEDAPDGMEKIEAEIEYLEVYKVYCNETAGMRYKVEELDENILKLQKKKLKLLTSTIDLSKQGGLKKSDTKYFVCDYSNIPEHNPLYPRYTKDSQDYAFFLENKDLTLDSKVDLFADFDKKTYDVAERYAIMADNSLRQKGNAYVFESIPEVFDGIKQEDIFENLSRFARSDKSAKYIDFEIAGKKFYVTRIGDGNVGVVYKIEDEAGHKVAMKIYGGRGICLGTNCGLGEIATSRKLTQDKVGDVPQFYMANAGLYKLGKQGEVYGDSPWMLSEFIDETKTPKEGTIKVNDW